MRSMDKLKDLSTYYATNKIIGLLSKASVDTFVNLTYWGEKLTRDPLVRGSIKHIRQLLTQEGHPARDIFSRVFATLSEEKRRRLFQSLFQNAWFMGGKKRDYWEEKTGFRPPFIMILSPTLHCNLRCHGCYTLGYGSKPKLPMELADRVLSECET